MMIGGVNETHQLENGIGSQVQQRWQITPPAPAGCTQHPSMASLQLASVERLLRRHGII